MSNEFEIIRTLFAPLAPAPAARSLLDDVAVIEAKGALVVTTDAIVEGVHFLADDPIDTVAKKALRVNISDLVAKGAKPVGALLTLIWPDARPAAEINAFARGLGEELQRYDLALWGGDTTATPGPLTVSVTAFGKPLGLRTPARGDAHAGEQVWVTGTIGDAYLGLKSLTGAASLSAADAQATQTAYRLPAPPFAFAEAIARFAQASMDVSDGLVGDAAKLAAASGVAIRLDAAAIPLSDAGRGFVAREGVSGFAQLLAAGDDYQALFTAATGARDEIVAAAKAAGVTATPIGAVESGAGVRVIGADGGALAVGAGAHVHRLGR